MIMSKLYECLMTEHDMEKYEWNMIMLTGKYWNPPDANKIEEALPESPQK